MASNQYYNKIIINGQTKIDLTGDTITADKLASGVTAHDRSGAPITGSNTYDADTSDATALASEILNTKTAYANGAKVTGTMPNRGAVTGTITDRDTPYTIQNGYHDGSGTVGLSSSDKAKLIPNNIRDGVTILGIEGTMSGSEDVKAQAKTATPNFSTQTIIPDSPTYNYLTQVTVNPIPVTESDNPQGGITVTVG